MDEAAGGSVTNWYHIQSYMTSLARSLNIGVTYQQTHLAWISFSDWATLEFNLNPQSLNDLAKAEMIQLFWDKTFTGGGTNTSHALLVLRTDVYTGLAGDRDNISNVAILLTDGKSTDQAATSFQALTNKLEIPDFTMMAIGLGENVDQDELRDIASGEDYVFFLDDFEELQTSFELLRDRTCSAGITAGRQRHPYPVLPINA